MKTTRISMVFAVVMVLIWTSCSTNTEMSTPGSSSSLTAVAQTSGQLASGTSFSISGSTSSGSTSGNSGMMGGPGGGPHGRGEGPDK
jgi:Flp pilus assembly secretin CpaC